MPKKGFKVISVHEKSYKRIKDLTKLLGCTITEIIDSAIKVYTKSDELRSRLDKAIEKRENELRILKALKLDEL